MVYPNIITLRFILPCKSDCHPIFGITQFVMQFTHVTGHFRAESRKLNIFFFIEKQTEFIMFLKMA